MAETRFKLIVTDIDNTIFDWVRYYVHACDALFQKVSSIIQCPPEQLAKEAKAVFTEHGSIEYPFLIQELPSVIKYFGPDIEGMLQKAVRPGRDAFLLAAEEYLQPYVDVFETLTRIKSLYPDVPLVALTDAPRYVAMWKLNKLGLLSCFDAVYGLPDPRLPTSKEYNRVKVDPEILLKHLQQSNFGFEGRIRVLPDDYEKPGVKGLKTVLMDFDMDESADLRRSVMWVGDNLRKDVGLGKRLGVVTAWAKYGTHLDADIMRRLHAFSPDQNIHKNVNLTPASPEAPQADYVLETFAEILSAL